MLLISNFDTVTIYCSHLSFYIRKYSSDYFFEEMRGLADGADVDYDLIVRLHMLPELVKVINYIIMKELYRHSNGCYICTSVVLKEQS